MKTVNILFITAIFLFSFSGFASDTEVIPGKVVKVTDGDTVKVRLAGIDCPARKQLRGQRAREAA